MFILASCNLACYVLLIVNIEGAVDMGGTAADLVRALSASVQMPFSTIEAYAVALGRVGWWERPKRGRGARKKTDEDAAKLLLAVLAPGPSDLGEGGFFLRYANMHVAPNQKRSMLLTVLRREMGLSNDAKFLDFAAAFIRLYRIGETDRVLWHTPSPSGFLGDSAVDVPDVEMRVKGPVAMGSFTFLLAQKVVDELAADGSGAENWLGPQTIHFVEEMLGQLDDAQHEGREQEARGFSNTFQAIVSASHGVGFERFIGGAEFDAVSAALEVTE